MLSGVILIVIVLKNVGFEVEKVVKKCRDWIVLKMSGFGWSR